MPVELTYIHDSTLIALELQWQSGIAIITFNLYNGVKKLFVDDVYSLQLNRGFEWGESYQVNSFSISPNEVEIEMQSGDIIKIGGTFRQSELP